MGDEVGVSEDNDRSLATRAWGGTLYLILIQVTSRAFTFAGNQVLLRFLSPTLLGIAAQLEVLFVSTLYLSRESLRVALQRLPTGDGREKEHGELRNVTVAYSQTTVNLSYIAIILGLPLIGGIAQLYMHGADAEVLGSSYFKTSFQIYLLATVFELLSEPFFMVMQERMLYGPRARAETIAATLKCFSACLTAYLMNQNELAPSILPFAIGQLAYGITLLVGYFLAVYPTVRSGKLSMLITPIERSNRYLLSRFYRPLLSLSGTLYVQSIFKQFLTQGDMIIMSFVATLADQGAFALASNYGGLIARMVFQPIEESSRSAFGKLLPTKATASKVELQGLRAATEYLQGVLHLYGIIAIFSCCFLHTLLPLAVRIVVGSAWFTPKISNLLSTYCYYIPFLAYNGILDAFVTSVATPAELSKQTFWTAVFTGSYVIAVYNLVGVLDFGAQGLVLGNIVNMTLRIIWSARFIWKYHWRNGGHIDVMKALPNAGDVVVGVITVSLLRQFEINSRSFRRENLLDLLPLGLISVSGGVGM